MTAASGLIIADKPPGWTSHDVVARVRRLAGTRRVGHAGTLDPMATGVLVLGVEKATRLLGYLALTEKEYQATIRLGQATDTGDADGTVTTAARASGLSLAGVRAATAPLTGRIRQVPPAVSAIKVRGRRSYQLAREGAAPVLAARPVTVWSFSVLAARPAGDWLDVDVTVRCSSGTYVRALARDLGEILHVGGHLTVLRRTRAGPYGLGMAQTMAELEAGLCVLPIGDAAAAAFPSWRLTESETAALSHGRRLPAPRRGSAPVAGPGRPGAAAGAPDVAGGSADALPRAGPVAAFAPDGTFIALVEQKDGEARPLAVFVP